ncbi:hypothetical protein SMI01S_06830 [Sphingobacterium mizutaii NBRC 14946 = DSM 11724]|uniref:Two-component sensor histidine kinase n=1 Tax=Sphingobacterium mizutaii NBRC 14946 = DSM 11724 TaxID=1220576 RepID=A0ABQ0VZL4_9SPHI|nr:hypothetical protein SMI01S_06830 [Sphingobacterium mizutaii NBRC 14946 = DSM 11724]
MKQNLIFAAFALLLFLLISIGLNVFLIKKTDQLRKEIDMRDSLMDQAFEKSKIILENLNNTNPIY